MSIPFYRYAVGVSVSEEQQIYPNFPSFGRTDTSCSIRLSREQNKKYRLTDSYISVRDRLKYVDLVKLLINSVKSHVNIVDMNIIGSYSEVKEIAESLELTKIAEYEIRPTLCVDMNDYDLKDIEFELPQKNVTCVPKKHSYSLSFGARSRLDYIASIDHLIEDYYNLIRDVLISLKIGGSGGVKIPLPTTIMFVKLYAIFCSHFSTVSVINHRYHSPQDDTVYLLGFGLTSLSYIPDKFSVEFVAGFSRSVDLSQLQKKSEAK